MRRARNDIIEISRRLDRTTRGQPPTATSHTVDTVAGVPLLPSASPPSIAAARHFAVAGDRQRIGAGLSPHRAGTHHRLRRVQVLIAIIISASFTSVAYYA